jgi:AraC family transcriptional regulator
MSTTKPTTKPTAKPTTKPTPKSTAPTPKAATKPTTKLTYARRIANVTDYIADHLDAPLELETLAAVAHFSPWHFHRLYRETTGETLGETVRRLRLHRAAGELLRGSAALERIARRAGYGSLAAFSRAFAADYGLPPGEYRKRGGLGPAAQQRDQGDLQMYEVTVAPFESVRLAAIEHRGDYQAVGRAFERALGWAAPRGLIGGAPRTIGIYYADAESVPAADLRAHAGVVITGEPVPADGICCIDIPPLLCASVLHKGPYAELSRPYRYLYREWLPASGREPADHPCFEEYLNDARSVPPSEWLTRIYLPLAVA